MTVCWSHLGFPVLESFAKRKTFTSDYFCETICPQFAEYAAHEMQHTPGRRPTDHIGRTDETLFD
jgi:hypothetical protein